MINFARAVHWKHEINLSQNVPSLYFSSATVNIQILSCPTNQFLANSPDWTLMRVWSLLSTNCVVIAGQKPEQLVPSAPDPVVDTGVSSAPPMVTTAIITIVIVSVVTPLNV